MPEYEAVTVTVPRESVPELLRYAADLAAGTLATRSNVDASGEAHAPRPRHFSQAAVRRAFNGGQSEYWRPFLALMAHHSLIAADTEADGWVEWATLHDGVGLTDRQAAGMLGAAERRLKGLPPYEKAYEDGKLWFRMEKAVADLVINLAGNGPSEPA